MKIHDEMSQIPVPEDLDEKHINPFYALKKQYKKIDFEKMYVVGTILSGDHFWNYSCYKPGNGRKYTDCRKCIYLYSGRH